MKQKKKIIVCGHICLDITPVFGKQRCENLSELLSPGKLVHMQGADVHVGGCVANTGLAIKRLGGEVSLMGKVGNDAFGRLVLSFLDGESKKHMLVSEDSATSYSVVLAPEGIDRIFLHDPGANDTFSSEDLDFDKIREADLFHFGYPPLMKRMYRNNGQELAELLERVYQMGVSVSLDMAAIDAASDAAEEDWKAILKRVLPYVDYFVPSAEELAFMIDRELYRQWEEKTAGKELIQGIDLEKDLTRLSDQLLQMGAKVILIKCGAKGLYLRTAKGAMLSTMGRGAPEQIERWTDLELFEECFLPEQVRSGTGAGDTTIAAFLTAVMEGRTWNQSMKLAAGTGACCVEAFDALSGLRSFEELEEKMERGWKKQPVELLSWEYSTADKCWKK